MANANKLTVLYYWCTPLFLLLDLIIGEQVRVSIPGGSQTVYYAYLATCFILGGFVFRRGVSSLLFGIFESSLNILFLILGVFLPVIAIAENPQSDSGFAFGTRELLNFLIAGSVLIYCFHANVHELNGAKHPRERHLTAREK